MSEPGREESNSEHSTEETQPESVHSSSEKMWKHPLDSTLTVPTKTAAVIAVMEMGVSDYDLIAHATDVSPAQVEQIDLALDPEVFRLCAGGFPRNEFFTLQHKLRCPSCNALTALAPCVACAGRGDDFVRGDSSSS